MANPPGRCIFCGAFGRTKEHVFPDWMRAIFPRLPTDSHTDGAVKFDHIPTIGFVPRVSQQIKQGQVGAKKVVVVCRNCNNGWLSVLENSAKLLLTNLLCGREFILSETDARLMATWIAKTTMTAEFIRPNETTIPQKDRTQLYETREPPPNWHIWIIPYSGSKFQAGGIYHHGIGIYLPPIPVQVGVRNTQYTVLGIGRVVAVAVSSTMEGFAPRFQNENGNGIVRLWPHREVCTRWPPPKYLTDSGLDSIIALFSKSLGVPHPPLG